MNKTAYGVIFDGYMQTREIEDCMRLKEVKRKIVDYICTIRPKCRDDIEDLLTLLGYEYERQGFSNGFEHALETSKHPFTL